MQHYHSCCLWEMILLYLLLYFLMLLTTVVLYAAFTACLQFVLLIQPWNCSELPERLTIKPKTPTLDWFNYFDSAFKFNSACDSNFASQQQCCLWYNIKALRSEQLILMSFNFIKCFCIFLTWHCVSSAFQRVLSLYFVVVVVVVQPDHWQRNEKLWQLWYNKVWHRLHIYAYCATIVGWLETKRNREYLNFLKMSTKS